MASVVIIEAGQAGFSITSKLRNEGYEGTVALIGGETTPPYQRCSLSKTYFLGEQVKCRLMLHPDSFDEEHCIDLRLGIRQPQLMCLRNL